MATKPTPSKAPWLQAGAAPLNVAGDVTGAGATESTPLAQTTPPAADNTLGAPVAPPVPPVVATPVLEAAKPDAPALEAKTVEVASELVDTVTVTVPKAFNLRLDNHRVIAFPAGVQEMERQHAEHWYSKAWGVVIYKAK